MTEKILSTLKHVRSSVIEGGGMTNDAEVIVRELRGEVIGMGGNLATKLEDAKLTRAVEDSPKGPTPDDFAQIVDNSLEELREQMAPIMDSHKEHSSAIDDFRAAMHRDGIHGLVKKALHKSPLSQLRDEPGGAGVQKDDVLQAVGEVKRRTSLRLNSKTSALSTMISSSVFPKASKPTNLIMRKPPRTSKMK
ncbi:hypothetical protein BDV06DRAFT_226623 [Aspergillus oleicola]